MGPSSPIGASDRNRPLRTFRQQQALRPFFRPRNGGSQDLHPVGESRASHRRRRSFRRALGPLYFIRQSPLHPLEINQQGLSPRLCFRISSLKTVPHSLEKQGDICYKLISPISSRRGSSEYIDGCYDRGDSLPTGSRNHQLLFHPGPVLWPAPDSPGSSCWQHRLSLVFDTHRGSNHRNLALQPGFEPGLIAKSKKYHRYQGLIRGSVFVYLDTYLLFPVP